jgi:hypothetical protein
MADGSDFPALPLEPFEPCVMYFRDADVIQFLREAVPHYAEYLHPRADILRAFDDKRIVGIQINGVWLEVNGPA